MSSTSTSCLRQLFTNANGCCSVLYGLCSYQVTCNGLRDGLPMTAGVWNPTFLDHVFGAILDNLYVAMIRHMNPRQYSWRTIAERANTAMEDTWMEAMPVLHDLLHMGANPHGVSRFCGVPHMMWLLKFGFVEVFSLLQEFLDWRTVLERTQTHMDQNWLTPFFGTPTLEHERVAAITILMRYGRPTMVEFILDNALRNPSSTLYDVFRYDHTNGVSQTNVFHEVFLADLLAYRIGRQMNQVLPYTSSVAIVLFRAIDRYLPTFWDTEEAQKMMTLPMGWGQLTATPLILFAQLRYTERTTRELWSRIAATKPEPALEDRLGKCAHAYATEFVRGLLSELIV